MDLICYIHPSWRPLIRPAEATRDWMTDSPESFAYRCLPLNIANAHGWEILSPCAFAAQWNGSMTPADIEKKQSLWWFVFLAGVLALLAESVLANRLSRRFNAGLVQPAQPVRSS